MKSFCSLDDDRLFFEAIQTNLYGKCILEVGSGIGTFASLLFCSDCLALYVGTELAADRIAAAHTDEFLISKKVDFRHVDGFLLDWSEFDIVVANPPMIPGELGYCIEGELFWERIRKKYRSDGYSGILYLHVFDFFLNGYRSESGMNIFDFFHSLDINLSIEKRWAREIGPKSAIRKWIDIGFPNCTSMEKAAIFDKKINKINSYVVKIQPE